ncbi:class I SAM-dependent methyltransferase [Phenylobacterium sp.]|uniref:class I SAM-dependent methyltransferase n=1 Tax=Phenylobacterium sp. TaxID=1871053 RepID=UPI0030F3E4F5
MTNKAARLSPDDLVGLAQAAWRHGERHCVDCGGYHQAWGILRAAGLHGGLGADETDLAPRLAAALSPGARVLVAGSADPGILDFVVRTAAGTPLDILVADLCATPLSVIGDLKPYPGMTVRTQQVDLAELDHLDSWDVIVSHSMLPHVPAELRIEVLKRLRRALAPRGRLVFVARTFQAAVRDSAAEEKAAWAQQTFSRVASSGIPMPASLAEIEALIHRYSVKRRAPPWDLATPEAIADLLTLGDFEVMEIVKMADRTHETAVGQARAKESYLFIAR